MPLTDIRADAAGTSPNQEWRAALGERFLGLRRVAAGTDILFAVYRYTGILSMEEMDKEPV